METAIAAYDSERYERAISRQTQAIAERLKEEDRKRKASEEAEQEKKENKVSRIEKTEPKDAIEQEKTNEETKRKAEETLESEAKRIAWEAHVESRGHIALEQASSSGMIEGERKYPETKAKWRIQMVKDRRQAKT